MDGVLGNTADSDNITVIGAPLHPIYQMSSTVGAIDLVTFFNDVESFTAGFHLRASVAIS